MEEQELRGMVDIVCRFVQGVNEAWKQCVSYREKRVPGADFIYDGEINRLLSKYTSMKRDERHSCPKECPFPGFTTRSLYTVEGTGSRVTLTFYPYDRAADLRAVLTCRKGTWLIRSVQVREGGDLDWLPGDWTENPF